MSETYVFYINGMTCISCSGIIESFLRDSDVINRIAPLDTFSVDVTAPDPKKTTITVIDKGQNHNDLWKVIKEKIEEIGFDCEPYEVHPDELPPPPPPSIFEEIVSTTKSILSSHWFLGALGCISGLILMFVFMATGGLPLAAMVILGGLSTALTLALGAKSYYEAWTKWYNARALTMDTLFAISTLAVIVVSIASFFIPWLPMMFEVGLLIFGFEHIGVGIKDTIKEKINSSTFQDRAPKAVRICVNNTLPPRIKKLTDVQVGDIIIVNPGEIIPLDGTCETESRIYNTIISGAILPRRFGKGDKVLAGMRLAENAQPLNICVSRTKEHSYLAHLDKGIAQSLLTKTPIELKTNQYLAYFIPTVIGIAVLSGLIIGIFFPPALAIQCAIAVLVSACPCTLGLIIPLAVVTGMNKAAENGVQFKNATILEQAEQVDVVVMDLHGSLTQGIPKIVHFETIEGAMISPDQLLNISTALEKKSTHRIGRAIYSFGKQKRSEQFNMTQINDTNHSGRSGQINGLTYSIGSNSLMRKKGISTAAIESKLKLAPGDSVIYLAREHSLIGYFIITDPLRPDAMATIKALTEMGKEIHMCTGADEFTAKGYAKVLGITTVQANCVATSINEHDKSKPDYIKSLKKKGLKVAMVGDAANDALAMAEADVGIAIVSHDSDEKTQQEAGAIIHSGNLLPIASAFAISQQTVTNIKQNLFMSSGYNLIAVCVASGLLIAIGITLNPAVGVALMAIQACIILLNVYRFKHQSLTHLIDAELSSLEEHDEPDPSSHSRIYKHMPVHQKEHSFEEPSQSNDDKTQEQLFYYSLWNVQCPSLTTPNPNFNSKLFQETQIPSVDLAHNDLIRSYNPECVS